ncbi:aspartokinase [Pseudozyma hubeiensis SY62]|uniref:Aspartokinase n=1 Tax=Pseudozyma hubeiensis (strain SY62) TaxID=1305764 RepID=R9P9N4_PSEHS|nr:aspartokinase [Pseudozyma hubeiensis SY62]GAC97952.1 aspartokinase [Pseudozyma hubeiensis SY62]
MRLIFTLAFAATLALLVRCAYDGALVTSSNHGYQMGRTELPGTLASLLRDPAGWMGPRTYPQAEVVPIATRAHPFTDHQVMQAIRNSAETRNMIVLGRPFPDRPGRQGFAAAVHIPAPYDRPNSKTFALVSVDRSATFDPRVHINGFVTVNNAPGIEHDIAGHYFPRSQIVEPGSTLTARELFDHLPR